MKEFNYNLDILFHLKRKSHSKALKVLNPPTFLHIVYVSTSLLQPLGQFVLLRFSSESIWPRPGVLPRAEPMGIQNNILFFCAQFSVSQVAVREETQHTSTSTLYISWATTVLQILY